MARDGEALPLLGLTRPTRIHYVDNLRASLTVLLICHHAAVECAQANLSTSTHIFININKSALWGLFFFVSGYSATLALGSSSSTDWEFFVKRMVKIGLPAWIYAVIGHRLLFVFLTSLWSSVFGNGDSGWVYPYLSGPVVYVTYLMMLDCLHLAVRFCKQHSPDMISAALTRLVSPSSQAQFNRSIELAATSLAVYIFISCIGGKVLLLPIYRVVSNDVPLFDAPLGYAIAYALGVNFPQIQSSELYTFTQTQGYIMLGASIILSSTSLAAAQQWSSSLQKFIYTRNQYTFPSPGFNFHTIFYAVWCTFVFFTIPYAIVCIYASAAWAKKDWGFLARHTYIQLYINMIPVLVGAYYTQRMGSEVGRILVVTLLAVLTSWIGMLGTLVIREKIGARFRVQT